MICRIFHKSGEKRTPLLQVQGHLDPCSSSPTKRSLPPLLAGPTSFTLELECQSQSSSRRDFQSPLLIHHQNQKQNHDISHTHLFPLHAFQPPFPTLAASVPGEIITDTRNHYPSSEQFFKIKEQTIPKLGKTEATFFQYQLVDDPYLHWMDKLNPNTSNFQNSNMPVEMDAAGLIAFSGTANAEIRDMSSVSIALHRAGLQHILDAPVGIEPWPQAQHV